MDQPPPVIRPQAALNERETMETEVISTLYYFLLGVYELIEKPQRTPHPLVLQYSQTGDD